MTIFFSWIAPVSVWRNNVFANCNLHFFFFAFINIVYPICMHLCFVKYMKPEVNGFMVFFIIAFMSRFALILLIQNMGNYANLYRLSKLFCQIFGKPIVHRSLIFDFLHKPPEPKTSCKLHWLTLEPRLSFPGFFADFLKDKENVIYF